MIKKAIAVLLCCVSATPSQAALSVARDGVPSGAQFVEWCSSPQAGSQQDTFCVGYIVGFAEGMLTADAEATSAGLHACIPNVVTSKQLVDVVRAALAATPDLASSLPNADAFIGAALYAAFPCK